MHYPFKYNVNTLNKLIVKIRPFIKYLESNYSEKMTHILRYLNIYCFNFNVFISYYDNNHHHYDILAKIIKHNNRCDVLITNINFDILQVSSKIHIEVEGHFLLETNPENEPIHGNGKLPTPPKPLKSFKTDTCVICLIKEPNVLFIDCRHICICLECDEIKPLGSVHIVRLTFLLKI